MARLGLDGSVVATLDRHRVHLGCALAVVSAIGAGCTSENRTDHDAGADASVNGCLLAQNTSPTDKKTALGCSILVRDRTACEDARKAAGLSGYWLEFSCRVELSATSTNVVARSDGQPDYPSNYFPTEHACHEVFTTNIQNPNVISAQSYEVSFPQSPNAASQPMRGAVVGLSLNGVPIFGNFAAPGDDIFQEAQTFDRCNAHPQMRGAYHYHSEPASITQADSAFVGVMRDGYPIYGRYDADGSLPVLDVAGGHTSSTPHSSVSSYHYHVNEQTSTTPGTAGQKQWFLTTGQYHGAPGACVGCN